MIFASAAQLLSRIVWLTKCTTRQWSSRIRHARDVRITQQRQNGVVERRGADLDLPALCRFAIGRKHQAKEFELLGFQGGFIALRKVFAFAGEPTYHVVFG